MVCHALAVRFAIIFGQIKEQIAVTYGEVYSDLKYLPCSLQYYVNIPCHTIHMHFYHFAHEIAC